MKRFLPILFALAIFAGSLSVFSSAATEKKTSLASIDHDINSGLLIIDGDYETTDRYAVLSGRLKAKIPVDHSDWVHAVMLGVSGTTNGWENDAFQIVYGLSETQNLVKLNNGKAGTFNNVYVHQEQWYNNAKLENIFTDRGIDIKVVRMDTWAYLLADMGDGYELIGRMGLDADAPTEFTLDNGNTPVRLSRLAIETGKDAALAALQGMSMNIHNWDKDTSTSTDPQYFPVDSAEWTLQARITLPGYADPDTADRRTVWAGPVSWNESIALLRFPSGDWIMQAMENGWSSSAIDSAYTDKLDPSEGGLWVRWVRNGAWLSVWVSPDGETWTYIHRRDTGAAAAGIYIDTEWHALLDDVSISLNGDTPSNVYLPDGGKRTPVFPSASLENEKWAVMTAHLESLTDVAHDWTCNVAPGVSGYESSDAFQICYGTSSTQNLVKLIDGKAGRVNASYSFDDDVPQEQWYNNAKLEKLFSSEGMDIKMIRMDYVAYLLADMGDGWEMIGRMPLASAAPTQFSLISYFMELRATNITVETGKVAAAAAFDGTQLKLGKAIENVHSGESRLFEFGEKQWVVDAQLVMPTEGRQDGQAMFSVMIPEWSQNVRINWNEARNTWTIYSAWSDLAFNPAEASLPAAGPDGKLWVRFLRDNNKFRVYASVDGVTYTLVTSAENYWENNHPFVIKTWVMGSEVTDFRVRIGAAGLASADMKSIAVTAQPAKKAYVEGEVFDPAGMAVTLTKQDGSTLTVPLADCTISPAGKLTTANNTITISYDRFSAVIPITVAARTVQKVELKDLPYFTEYALGGVFNAAGATYIITYSNGDTEELDISTAMCGAVDTSVGGEKPVKVTVEHPGGKTELTFTIRVKSTASPVDPDPEQTNPVNPDPEQTNPVNPNQPDGELPNTGVSEGYAAVMAALLLSAGALAVATVMKKKRVR